MKRILLLILALFLIVACEKDQMAPVENDEALTTTVDLRGDNSKLAEKVGLLIEDVENLDIPFGPKQSILVQLRNIQNKLERGQTEVGLAMLEDLIAHVEELVADETVAGSDITGLLDDLEWIRCEVDPECENVDLLEVWIDDPDGDPNTNDGYTLYVHPYDQRTGYPESNGVQWGGYGTDIGDCVGLGDLSNYAYVPFGPYPDGNAARDAVLTDFDGELNTQKITCALGDGDYAAKVCADLSGEEGMGYDDWNLPSLGELNAIYEQLYKDAPGGNTLGTNNFNGYFYWSSSEGNANYAWVLYFYYGGQGYSNKYYDGYSCRCVRR